MERPLRLVFSGLALSGPARSGFGPAPARLVLAALVLVVLAAGCATPDAGPGTPATHPALETHADSVAMRIVEASGGLDAWASVPYLRFDFAVGSDSLRNLRARHLWNRQTGAYRVEMMGGPDTVYVALFDVDTREGTVYLNGQPVDTTRAAELLQGAYGRFINDTYWLLAPLKVFDPGVRRTYAADSSGSGAEVVSLAFEDVGLTPGDRYWLYADPATGRMTRWAFRLQGFEPTTPTSFHAWDDYAPYEAPAGTVYLAARKRGAGGGTIYTDQIALPADVPEDLFTDPNPRL